MSKQSCIVKIKDRSLLGSPQAFAWRNYISPSGNLRKQLLTGAIGGRKHNRGKVHPVFARWRMNRSTRSCIWREIHQHHITNNTSRRTIEENTCIYRRLGAQRIGNIVVIEVAAQCYVTNYKVNGMGWNGNLHQGKVKLRA